MKKGNVLTYKETSYLLEEGKDFTQEDLDDAKIEFNNEFRAHFYQLGLGSLEWSGCYNPETKTVKVKVREELFI